MATLPAPALGKRPELRSRRPEDIFFTTAAVLMLGIIVAGFAPSYFLRGAVFAQLPSLLVHLHGAVFSSWIILFVIQSSLVSAGNLRLHRRLGTLGGILAALMVILGVLAPFGTLRRHAILPSFFTPASFLIGNIIGILYFGLFVAFALWKRNDRVLHKRTMFAANAMLLSPALFRMTIYPFMLHHIALVGLIPLGFIAALLLFDLARLRKPFVLTRKAVLATLILGFLFWVIDPVSDLIIATPASQHLADWAQHHP